MNNQDQLIKSNPKESNTTISSTEEEKNIILKRVEMASILYEVSDPELPGISIVDLGMVVDIFPEDDHWHVMLATTYSGCPAIDVIPMIVSTAFEDAGVMDVKVSMGISPPWSTDWISEVGKEKLLAYGIAPPNGSPTIHDEGKPKQCPQCGSTHTSLISLYGSTPCKASYRCETCREPFEYFKCF